MLMYKNVEVAILEIERCLSPLQPLLIQNVAIATSIVFLTVMPFFRNSLKLSALLIAASEPSISKTVREGNYSDSRFRF
jgi:hypothetical protein